MGFDGTLKFDTAIDKTGFKVGIGQLGNLAKSGMAAIAGAVTAGAAAMAAGVAAIGKEALDAYAEYEQLVGGVETLFKESADIVQRYADNAFQSAGMSANAYMETVTSFSAALLQGLGGDTEAAAEIANQAIVDMSDNANKMGSDISMIQNAYQGFAKQNYTMLDNLKLGYGGTQAEMARLINDSGVLGNAMKVTADTVKSVSFDKIIEAIHVVQTEMGISGISAEEAAELVASGAMTQEEAFELMGTTAKEAATTIQGSISMAGAAWQNFLTGLGNKDADLSTLADQLTDSVMTAAQNIIPVTATILRSMAESVTEYLPEMAETAAAMIEENAPAMAKAGQALISALGEAAVNGIDNLPGIAESGTSIIRNMVSGVRANSGKITNAVTEIYTLLAHTALDLAPDLLAVGMELIVSLAEGFAEEAPDLLSAAETGIKETAGIFMEHLPEFARAGMSIIRTIGSAVLGNLPELVSAAITAVSEFCGKLLTPENLELLLQSGYAILTTVTNAVLENLPELIDTAISLIMFLTKELLSPDNVLTLIETAAELLVTIVNAIADNADELFLAAEEIVRTLCDELTSPENLSEFVRIATELVAELIVGLCDLAGKFLGFAALLNEEVSTSVEEIDWAEVGIAIVEGICSGLLGCDFELDKYLEDFGENWVSGIKDIFGIHSPSKLMEDSVGKYLALGIGEGFSAEAAQIGEDIMQAVTEWTALLPAEAQAAAEDFLNNTDDLFTELPVQMAEHLEDTISEAIAFGKDLAVRGRNAASGMVANIMDIADDLPDKLASVGRNLVEGLWNGITGMGSWLKSQISGFADSVLSGFTEAFGIHSPSTVMRDYVGKFLAQGIGVGFTEEIPQIGEAAVKAFTDLELPEMTVRTKLPDTVDAGAVQALRSMRTDTSIAAPSPTSSIVNNYSYSTVNHNAPQADVERPVINLYATFEMDGEAIADGAAERIDEKQGAKINLKTRGVSI